MSEENKETTETTEKKKRNRRTTEQKLQDLEKEIERLKNVKKDSALSAAIEGGHVSKENVDEYRKMQKATRSIAKVIKLSQEFERKALGSELSSLNDAIMERMRELLESSETE